MLLLINLLTYYSLKIQLISQTCIKRLKYLSQRLTQPQLKLPKVKHIYALLGRLLLSQ